MSTSLGYSIIENFDNKENNNIKRRNKTLKNQKKDENMRSMEKVNSIREKMGLEHLTEPDSVEPLNEDSGEGLANFDPPPKIGRAHV